MKLEWMRSQRSLIEQLIRCGNTYAYTFRKQRSFGTDMKFSASQIQVMEYILEAEDSDETMTEMAERLGVSKANFSKNVTSLVEKGLLEKFHCVGNNKNIYVKPTDRGRETYKKYTEFICKNLFDEVIAIADKIPKEYLKEMEKMLSFLSDRLLYYQNDNNDVDNAEKEKVFIKIS
ncbi:MAG: MarR family winged helix-turn-helix transcriptional regulator [Candidatus Alectryocaccobium sp.]|jgi:DNA-binding MarR family transcriptional regulator|nr:MarR family winged helix-turn-helix transcriptional regulator [Lachnospiraceae bacterium]